MFYKEWVDFVIFPLNGDKVTSREQRLDISNAVRVDDESYTPENGTECGVIFPKEWIFLDGDEFQEMFVGDDGQVFIWTEKRVWTLYCRLDGAEKAIYLPRNPDSKVFK